MSNERRTQTCRDWLSLAAYVSPFVVYVGLTMVESTGFASLNYEVVCTLKGGLAGVALWYFRRHYPPLAVSGFGRAIVAGILGCGVWIALERFQATLPGTQQLTDLLGIGRRAGFDPYSQSNLNIGGIAFLIVRLIELIAIVPFAEEIFWRGFLARYLIAEDFEAVPQGKFTSFSFGVVTLAFASAHPEFLAAIAWGAMINALYRKTANLWACVLMHSVTNGFLAVYILTTQSWHLW